MRPTTHLTDDLGVELSVSSFHHSRDLELRDEDNTIVLTEEKSQFVMTLFDFVLDFAKLAVVSTSQGPGRSLLRDPRLDLIGLAT